MIKRILSGVYLLLFSACIPDFESKDFPPSVEINSPASDHIAEGGKPFNQGEYISFDFLVGDPDTTAQDLNVLVLSNINGTLFQGAPDADGQVQFLNSSLFPGVHQISLVIEDESNIITEKFTLSINTLPWTPVISLTPEFPKTGHELYVDVEEYGDDDGDTVVLKIEWLKSGEVQEGQESVNLDSSLTQKGERWTVRVTPEDEYGTGVPATAAVLIQNTEPEIVAIGISSEAEFHNDQDLQCLVEGVDVDGDEIEISHSWELLSGGQLIALDVDSDFLPPSPLIVSPGDRVFCNGTISDGEDSLTDKAFVDILNRAPTLSNMVVFPATQVRAGMEVHCGVDAMDPDLSTLELDYKWYNNGDLIGFGQSISLNENNATRSDVIRCDVRASDPHGAEASLSSEVTVANSPPVMDDVQFSTNSPGADENLQCLPIAHDIDTTDTVSFDYEWMINGVLVSNGTDTLSGNDYGYFSVGDQISCKATPTDGIDSGVPMTNFVVVVNSPPNILSLDYTLNNIYTDTNLTVTASVEDVDGDALSHDYHWYVDGGLVQTGPYNTLDGNVHFDKDQLVYVTLYVSDDIETDSAQSSPIQIQNSPPTPPAISLHQHSLTDDDLQCLLSSPSTDPDGDPVSYTHHWMVNGAPPPIGVYTTEYTDDSVYSSVTLPGEYWLCGATASDGEESSEAYAETRVVACPVHQVNNMEEAFADLDNLGDCWSAGKSAEIPPVNLSPFAAYHPDFNGDGLNGLSFTNFGWNVSRILQNNTADFVSYDYSLFPPDVLAVYPRASQPVYLRWTAPLSGVCTADFVLTGLTQYVTAYTTVNVHMYLNTDYLTNQEVNSYGINYEVELEEFDVLAGDELYITIDNNGSNHYDWVQLSGNINCNYSN